MALLQKIFSSKKSQSTKVRKDETTHKVVSPKLDKSKIRLVIYAESDRGRTPFFDSDAIKVVEDTDKAQNVVKSASRIGRSKIQREKIATQPKSSSKYDFSKLGNDVKVLAEMMFGTVALAFKGSSLKVHVLRSPNKLMLTKVFFPEKPREEVITSDSGAESLSYQSSCADFSSGEYSNPTRKSKDQAKSVPVDVPSKEFLSDCSTDDDSSFASFTSSGSLRGASFPSPSNNSLSSFNSLHKRWMRSQTTSLDGNHRRMTYDPGSSLQESGKKIRRHRLAVGILFGSYEADDEESYKLFRSFIFSHFALIEGHLEKLCRTIEKAYFYNKTALPVTMEALDQFRSAVHDLYMAPRLPEPAWLTMMSTTTYRLKLCEKYMKEFNSLVHNYDNKTHNFFVSTLLSAVLTHHLAWVATVSPAGGTPTKTYLDKHTAKWIDSLARTHPYNPLWAQLGDLYGAIGNPLKISRTIVVGKKADLVKRFLYILSYFIRCSDMQECSCGQSLSHLITVSSNMDESISPTSSEKTITDTDESSHSSPSYLRQNSSNSLNFGVSVSADSSGDTFCSNKSRKASVCKVCKNQDFPSDVAALIPSSIETPVLAPSSCSARCSEITPTTNKKNSLGRDTKNSDGIGCQNKEKDQCTERLTSSSEFHLKDLQESGKFDSIPLSSSSSNSSFVFPSISHLPEALSELHIYSPTPSISCNLSPLKVNESPSVENMQLSNKAAVWDKKGDTISSGNSVGEVGRSQSFSDGKVKSRLTQLLAASESTNVDVSNSKKSELRKMFRSEGSSSMFDEYYESGIEVKTIDAIPDTEIVPSLPTQQLKIATNSDNVKDNMETDVKKLYSRQSSYQDSRYSSGRARAGSISRSKGDLNKRRHLSSTSSIDYDAFDPMTQCKEIKLPNLLCDHTNWNIRSFDRNFGRSLMASYTDHYMSDFVLLGTSDQNFRSRLLQDLQMAVQHSVLDEPIDEAVCVIADTDNWTVEVASSKMMNISPSGSTSWMPSPIVADLIESVVEISKFKMGAEFCLMTIEDRLQEIYFKSIILSEYLNGGLPLNQQDLSNTLSFERSDLPLLIAVARTHTPNLNV